MVLRKEIALQIKDLLKENPQGLSITDIVKVVTINRNTAGRYLENLLISGQVEMRRLGMAKIYMISHRVPLSAVLSISSELIMQLDSSLRIIFANEPFLKLVGTDSKNLLGKNIEYTPVALVFDDLFPGFHENIREGLMGKEWSGEIALSTKDIIFFCRIAPTVFDDGRKGVSVLLEDITQRKKVEVSLKESEDRYRQLVDISPDAVIIHREDKIIFMNPAALNLLGASHSDEIIGKNVLDCIHPDFRDAVRKNIEKDLGDEITPPTELHMLRVDGTSVIVEGRGVKTFIDGKPALQVAIRDITERKRAEEALRESEGKLNAMLQSIDDPMSMMDKDLTIIWANEPAKRYFGKNIIGKKCYEAYHLRPVPCEPYPCLTLKAFLDGKTHRHDIKVIDSQGKERFFECTASVALRDNSGKPVAVLETSRDITNRKMAEDALRESEAIARALINAPTDSVILMDTQGIILALNETAALRFGKRSDDLVGILADNLLPKELARSRRALVTQVIEKKQMVRFEDERDGRWYDTVAYPITSGTGEVIKIAIIARDITERRNI